MLCWIFEILIETFKEVDRMTIDRTIVAISVGDPHGVGSELVLKSMMDKEVYQKSIPVVISDSKLLEHTQNFTKTTFRFRKIKEISEAEGVFGTIEVIDIKNIDWTEFKWGQISKMSGRASLDYIEKSMQLAINKEIDAFVYAPTHKENMKLAGLKQNSEIEYMQELTGSKQIITFMLWGKTIITRVTTHVPLKDVASYITKESVLNVIKMANENLKRFGFASPRIGLGALNPHMGEGGLCGREEVDAIIPAIEAARGEGINVIGLYPADAFYLKLNSDLPDEKPDLGIFMYHDTANVTAKTLGLNELFTLTAGLPIPVFTVGHGTRYRRAGKNECKEGGFLNAIQFAARAQKAKNII
jgi:4-phospho-D-threonate 3-dehydrogenase / 4-phospho-D-erythronate 3-dehydrogenase